MDERNFQYMFYGFAAAWLVIVLYVMSLVARERKMRDELITLKNMMRERESK